MTASAIGSTSAAVRCEQAIAGGGRQRPQRRGHQLRAAEDHRRHESGRLVELVVTAGRAGEQGDAVPGTAASTTSGPTRSADGRRPGAVPRDRVTDIAVGGGGMADVEQPARARAPAARPASSARVGAPEQLDPIADVGQHRPAVASARRNAWPDASRQTAGRAPSPAEKSGRWSGTRGSSTSSGGSSRRPHRAGARDEWTMFGGAAISTSTSSISR